LSRNGEEVAEKQIRFKVNFVKREVIELNDDTIDSETIFNSTKHYQTRSENKWTNRCDNLWVNKSEIADPFNPKFIISNIIDK
jgi:hypothetical protein